MVVECKDGGQLQKGGSFRWPDVHSPYVSQKNCDDSAQSEGFQYDWED